MGGSTQVYVIHGITKCPTEILLGLIRKYKTILQYYFFFTYNIIGAKWQSNTEVICVHTLTFIPITIHRTYFNSLITGMICNKYVNIL